MEVGSATMGSCKEPWVKRASFQPFWVLYVYSSHELIQCLSFNWNRKWCCVSCPFLPTSVGTVVLTSEKGAIGLENKKGWEGEEGAWSPGMWLWHGLWCERHSTEEQGCFQQLGIEGGMRESAYSSFRGWHRVNRSFTGRGDKCLVVCMDPLVLHRSV